LGELIDIFDAVKRSGIELFIGIADEPVQGDAQGLGHLGGCVDGRLHLVAFIAADGRTFSAQMTGQILLADYYLIKNLEMEQKKAIIRKQMIEITEATFGKYKFADFDTIAF
jgi:hypothetical protein